MKLADLDIPFFVMVPVAGESRDTAIYTVVGQPGSVTVKVHRLGDPGGVRYLHENTEVYPVPIMPTPEWEADYDKSTITCTRYPKGLSLTINYDFPSHGERMEFIDGLVKKLSSA